MSKLSPDIGCKFGGQLSYFDQMESWVDFEGRKQVDCPGTPRISAPELHPYALLKAVTEMIPSASIASAV